MTYQPPRGTRDILPEEMAKRQWLYDKVRAVFKSYGFGEVWTPAFEDFDLLAKKSGPDIEKEIYVFTDKSGRKLGLRFDPTVPICRIVAGNPSLTLPAKFCYITNMWRYDNPQAGRFREFWQCGVEVIGPRSIEADVEVLSVVNDILKSVGCKSFYFRINSREVIEGLIKEVDILESRKFDAFRALDKLGKIGEQKVIAEMEASGIKRDQAETLLEMVIEGKADKERLKSLERIKFLAKQMGIKNIEIDLSSIRGIDYYTGFVFETLIKGYENLGSIAGGGRYDTLIGLYGPKQIPATGFGMGIERLLETLKLKGDYMPAKVYIANVNEGVKDDVLKIAQQLRGKGVSCLTDLMGRNLSKQLEYASSLKIPYVLFVGAKEIAQKKFTLRNMKTGKEKKVALAKLKSGVK